MSSIEDLVERSIEKGRIKIDEIDLYTNQKLFLRYVHSVVKDFRDRRIILANIKKCDYSLYLQRIEVESDTLIEILKPFIRELHSLTKELRKNPEEVVNNKEWNYKVKKILSGYRKIYNSKDLDFKEYVIEIKNLLRGSDMVDKRREISEYQKYMIQIENVINVKK